MQRWTFTTLLCLLAAIAIASGREVQASERIHSYHSDVDIHKDGSLKVVETITVTAEGDKIERGIYRDFPVAYTTRYWVPIKLPFHVDSVKRDGQSEPFHTEDKSNGVRVYVGNADFRLPQGKYTYEITYTTNFQLGYFQDHDELYWNVTGNGWNFPIDQASATVSLPAEVPRDQLTHEAYTGPQGAHGKAYSSHVDQNTGKLEFKTTQELQPHEGLTIVVGFPKGYIDEPTAAEKSEIYVQADDTLMTVVGGVMVVLAYYMIAWFAVGRDPPGSAIYPQFEPPLGLSPASVRYLRNMAYDKKCFTAALINLAVKKQVEIEEDDGTFSLLKTDSSEAQPLSPGESKVYSTLLTSKFILLKQFNHKRIGKAVEKLGETLSKEYEGKLFAKNRWWLVPGWLLSALAIALVAYSVSGEALGMVGFFAVWLSGWTLGCVMLAKQAITLWRNALSLRKDTLLRIGSFGGAIFATAFAIPFFAAEIFVLGVLVTQVSLWMAPLLVALVAINWSFWHWIKQPSLEGRRVMDEIEGFRMYLRTAEGEFLQRMHSAKMTPELFEKYLPYALALDVENEWAEKFSNVLQQAAMGTDQSGRYHPAWYHGSAWSTATMGEFASGLGNSLGGAISSSSTAPGSSSGGGGGGSSGGGGGGGGGGGW